MQLREKLHHSSTCSTVAQQYIPTVQVCTVGIYCRYICTCIQPMICFYAILLVRQKHTKLYGYGANN